MRLCRELIELGINLARAAADRALDDIAAPPPVAAIPGSSAAAITQAEYEAQRRAPDYGKLFTHLSRAVRQTMLLEIHIAEGRPPAPDRASPPASSPPVSSSDSLSPTQSPLPNSSPVFSPPGSPAHAAATLQPLHETLKRETVERMDCLLTAHADGQIPVEDLLQTIGEKFGLHAGAARQPKICCKKAEPTRPIQSSPPKPPPSKPASPDPSSPNPAPPKRGAHSPEQAVRQPSRRW